MSPSERAAAALVRDYLNGRRLPQILHGAVVWVAQVRLSSGKQPVLDATLCADIDSQAVAPPALDREMPPSLANGRCAAVCALLRPECVA